MKWGLEADHKTQSFIWGYNSKIIYKFAPVPLHWQHYQNQLTQSWAGGGSWKSDGKKKLESKYCGHLLTNDKHKFYFEHCLTYEPKGDRPFSNTFTFNGQDSDGVGNFNTNMYAIWKGVLSRILKSSRRRSWGSWNWRNPTGWVLRSATS